MNDDAQAPYSFGDTLALARASWVRAMATRVAARGHYDYRRSDAWLTRALVDGEVPLGALGSTLAVTRQAVRKLVDGLVARGYAEVHVDPDDSRRRNVVLSALGDAYARDVIAVIDELNAELVEHVEPEALAATLRVLAMVRERPARNVGEGAKESP